MLTQPAAELDVIPPAERRQSYNNNAATASEKKAVWIYRIKLLIGLMLPFFLSVLDTTIVATALPTIAAHFHQLPQQTWIVTAFSLTNAAFIPAFGQLTDVFGRHTMLQTSLVLMWLGSGLCTAAQTWGMLLLGRAIVGISSAGLMVTVIVILSDRVSLAENALQHTIFSLVGGSSYAIGPVIGGRLAAAENWRWCFGIALPLSVVAHLLVFFVLRHDLVQAQPLRIFSSDGSGHLLVERPRTLREQLLAVDWPGLALCVVGCILLTLALLWGGSVYAWKSAQVLVPLLLGVLILVVFIGYQLIQHRFNLPYTPLIPPMLFAHSKDFALLCYISLTGGATLYAVFYFTSLYHSLSRSLSPSSAGEQLLYFIPGLGGGAYVGMYLCNVRPRETFPPLLLGAVALTLSCGLMAHGVHTQHKGLVTGMTVLAGVGYGVTFMPVTLHTCALHPGERLATANAVGQFFEPLGGTLATAMMGSVLGNKAGVGLQKIGGDMGLGLGLEGPGMEEVREAVREGVRWAFVAISPVVGLGLLATLGLGVVVVRGKGNAKVQESEIERRWAVVGWWRWWRTGKR